MKTIEIKATPNSSKRTFTLRLDGKKYRTISLSKAEFIGCLFNTENDWKEFLKTDQYYVVK